jgi:hypothetical protein
MLQVLLRNITASFHNGPSLCSPGVRYLCNQDTVTGAAWKRGSIPIEFLFQCVHLAACCCCCCCFVFITVLCLFGDIPRLVSLLPDARLLTFQLLWKRRPGYTALFPPAAEEDKSFDSRDLNPGRVIFCFFLTVFILYSFILYLFPSFYCLFFPSFSFLFYFIFFHSFLSFFFLCFSILSLSIFFYSYLISVFILLLFLPKWGDNLHTAFLKP